MSHIRSNGIITKIDGLFKRFELPVYIPRLTFHDADALGITREAVDYLDGNSLNDYYAVYSLEQFVTLALLTRLCTIEDRIERGELKPVVRCVDCTKFCTHKELPGSTFCAIWCHPVALDFYCAYGTRK